MTDRTNLLNYLKDWQKRTSYESIAMSEARFSDFLDGLIELIEPEDK